MTTADMRKGLSGLATIGIRPGAWLITIEAGRNIGFASCSANFVFVRNGVYGLGTAGHCAAGDALGRYADVPVHLLRRWRPQLVAR